MNDWLVNQWLVMDNSLVVSNWYNTVDNGFLVFMDIDMGTSILVDEGLVGVNWLVVVLGVVHGLLMGLNFTALNIHVGTLTVWDLVMDMSCGVMSLVWLVFLLEGSVMAVTSIASIGVVVRGLVTTSSVVRGKLPLVVSVVVSVCTRAVFTMSSSVVLMAEGLVVTVVWVRVGTVVTVGTDAVFTVITIGISITMARRAVILRVLVVLSICLVVVVVVLGLEVTLLALSVRLLVVAVVVDVLANGFVVLGSNHSAVVLVEVDLRVAVDWLVMVGIDAAGVVCGHVSTDTMTTVMGSTVGVAWVAIGVTCVASWDNTIAVAWVGVSVDTAVSIAVVGGSVGESSCAGIVVGWDGNSSVIFSVVLVAMMVAIVAIVVRSVVVLGVRPVLDMLGRFVAHVVTMHFFVVVVELVVGLSLSLSGVSDGSNNGKSKRSHLYFFQKVF